MNITIPAVGTRGDIQPMVALGKGLRTAGHRVKIATHAMFDSFVTQHGLDFHLMEGANPKDVVDQLINRSAKQRIVSQLRDLWQLIQLLKSEVKNGGESCLAACQGADLVIYSVLGYPLASAVAKKLNIREVFVALQPFEATAEFPFLMMTTRNLGGFLNRCTYPPGFLTPWLPIYSAVNAWMQQRLQLPPFPWNYPLRWMQKPLLRLYGFSPHVLSKPADWARHSHITGYWFLEQPEWQPPSDLMDFLNAGPPPIYVGFGSIVADCPEATAEIVLQALEHTKQRGLLLTGWGGLQQTDLPDHIFKLEAAPHDWLFPRMAAVVHHGGAGTTAAGLRAGVPNIIVPFFLDQPFWGHRVKTLKVGPAPISRKQLSIERLSNAIQFAVKNTAIRQRAAELGERIRAENGVKAAVDLINSGFSE
jgi:UDP:flavonoid glycosyltransferase YjiC (YdhE family)